jgi:hypothetical protein
MTLSPLTYGTPSSQWTGAEAARRPDVEAVSRPAVHRQGPRHRRPLHEPTENALVLCVDEKSQIQALDRTALCLPMLPTTPARMTHDYVRSGTTSLFAAHNLASGSALAQPYRRH